MSNPPKKKGTAAEGEVVKALVDYGLIAKRTSPGMKYDVDVAGSTGHTVDALATRPDNGKWLVTISLNDFRHLLFSHGDSSHIEVKRYKRFSLHRIFEEKFR